MNIQGFSRHSNLNQTLPNNDNDSNNDSSAATYRSLSAAGSGVLLPQPDASRTLTRQLREGMLAIAGCSRRWSAIPLQGSGAFAVEAMLCSLLSANDHLLIVANGGSASRMVEICHIHHIRYSVLPLDTRCGIDLARVTETLAQDSSITHLAAVHFEAELGVKNDIDGLARLAMQHGCRLLVDISATFGVLPLNFTSPALAAAALSISQCLHGAPGMAFVLVCRSELTPSAPPRVFSLDLKAQYMALKKSGLWRFTPPLSVMQDLQQALEDYQQQGGREARFQLYCQRMIYLLKGMAALGFRPLVEPQHCAPLFVTLATQQGLVDFNALHQRLKLRNIPLAIIRNGPNSLRIGVQGEISVSDIDDLLVTLQDVIEHSSLHQLKPVPSD